MSEAIKNETTEMAVASGYSAIANMDFLAEAMNDDCAGLDFKFDRIKIPSGGMTAFEVPSEDGEGSDLVKEIEAVILYSHPANSYYTEAYKGGSNPLTVAALTASPELALPAVSARTVRLTSSAAVRARAKPARTAVCCTCSVKMRSFRSL